ncbi:hypothetical protein [Acidomonas methanolica]|uniref:Uncharacterized protein n=1 Tax=Acidomonas methanolica NBRC 104435 TaxID=1231351 RepID=A0A023DAM7_ACIMT|nr:hypothetical protein [Acidomonas methanolica]MCQ9155516.1 hypothetical protein [Acidomonas methanolica]TCS27483.1 hypothetical protein EDC31_11087 [Acidomonas methanolica]GAJ30785.1 hypothetical protein Amme_361_002 [Acidomonas methanolica NBRC 104435]GBQ53640.1 hypothetical protein AA0498_1978 [Acidomonas methanolica]GEK98610.1 hypothetical protein AME01nite_11090 [Acidomonas methanolica NBRC 104435]
MILLAETLLWSAALLAHALRQVKFRRLLHFTGAPPPRLAVILPILTALALAVGAEGWRGLVGWFGTASLAGLLVTAGLTRTMQRHHLR